MLCTWSDLSAHLVAKCFLSELVNVKSDLYHGTIHSFFDPLQRMPLIKRNLFFPFFNSFGVVVYKSQGILAMISGSPHTFGSVVLFGMRIILAKAMSYRYTILILITFHCRQSLRYKI